MASPFSKDFDTILFNVLTDYSNLDSSPDVSAGSMPFISGSVLSSSVWGLYRYQDWIHKQHFPDTSATDALNHWGSIYDIKRVEADTNTTYLNKILSFLRQPPAGGNNLDFKNWALDQDESYYESGGTTYYNGYVHVVDTPDNILGTVGVYTIPNDETIIDVVGPPNIEELLRVATETYIESERPLGLLSVSVVSAKPTVQAVSISVTAPEGGTVDTDTIETAVENYMDTLEPGESLYASILTCLALTYGAYTAVVTTPAIEETTADNDEFYRPGVVTITEV